MQYVSTRGGMAPKHFSEILLDGLAPDGGLIIPETYPRVSNAELAEWRELNYRELAYAIISKFTTDIPAQDLKSLIDKTYTAEAFGSDVIAPVTPLSEGTYLLSLANGPTLAFKDLAMQLLGNLFEYVLDNSNGHLNVLGATSGDTGSSAEYAMRGKGNVKVFMLSPYGKMSPFQTAQMYSLREPNIFNIAVHGVFDDCQDMVKAVSEDVDFKTRYRIGTVNSINWGRVTAQVVYYFKGYFAVTKNNHQQVSFSVPSGNFGNICAAHVARQMGLPVRRLILASNENNVLDEFFHTGVYRVRPRERVVKTSSPSMDISKASNFERFVYDLVGRNADKVRELWQRVTTEGSFDLSASEAYRHLDRFGFVSGTSNHHNRLATIRKIYDQHGIIIETHTADGVKVGLEYKEKGIPLVCLETALPAKFEASILEAIGLKPRRPPGYENVEDRPQYYDVMDRNVAALKDYIVQHATLD